LLAASYLSFEEKMMSVKPTIVLVHGFLGGAAHWAKVIIELSRKGYTDLHAVELPLTSLADDAERTKKMVLQQEGPVLWLVTPMGRCHHRSRESPNVVGLVYIAAFATGCWGEPRRNHSKHLPVAAPNLAPDSDGFLWIKADKFHEASVRT